MKFCFFNQLKKKAQECVNPNEEWLECGTACPITCQNYKNPPQVCVLMCKIGCACKSPYIRDETSGRCVLTRDCGNTE